MDRRGNHRTRATLRDSLLALLFLLVAVPVAHGQTGTPPTDLVGSSGPVLTNPGSATRAEAITRTRQLQDRNLTLLGTGTVDPDAYVVGPGDLLRLEVRGALSLSASALVAADGSVTFPQIGTLPVGGLTLTAARADIKERARRLISGAEITLVLDSTRAFKVEVVGRVPHPGTVAATALTRVSEVLEAAGGPSDSTSVRRIRVRHTDGTEEAADLLGFLFTGRLRGNPTVRDGDVVVVPYREDLVTFEGAVFHPGSYDFVVGDELGDLLDVVGPRPDADPARVLIQRTSDNLTYDTLGVALPPVLAGEVKVPLRPGDRVLMRAIGEWRPEASATVSGAVASPGPVPVDRGRTRVGDAVRAAGGLAAEAVAERIVLVRALPPDSTGLRSPTEARNYATALAVRARHETVVDLRRDDGPLVEPGDRIEVPRRLGWIELTGQVKRPGFYDYHEDWSVTDYVEAAGGFGRQARKSQTRVTRGAAGDVVFASDLEVLAPGDMVWVPEKPPGSFWQSVRDVTGLTSTVVTLFLLIREVTR